MSGLYQNTICIFNKYTKIPSNYQGGLPPSPYVAYEKTRIRNVMWKDNVHTNSTGDGKSFIDKTVSVTIPLDEMRTDKKFVEHKDFVADTGLWTLKAGDIIVFGECDKEIDSTYTADNLRSDYKTMEIRAVSDSTNQDTLPKWSVEGV